jgi:hypothetical protein
VFERFARIEDVGVPAIGETRCPLATVVGPRTGIHRRPRVLEGRWPYAHAPDGEPLTEVMDFGFAQEPGDQRQSFLHQRGSVNQWDIERLEVVRGVASTDGELPHSSVRDDIDHGHLLCHLDRMIQRQEKERRAEFDRLGFGGDAG